LDILMREHSCLDWTLSFDSVHLSIMTMKKILYTLSCVWLLLSCDSILDEEPRSLIDPDRFYVTEADGVAALAGIYHHLMVRPTFGAEIDSYAEFTSDLLTPTRALGAGRIAFAFRWDQNAPVIRSTWQRLYQAVNDANVLITKIPESSLEQEVEDELVAEAVFLRAFTYYHLTALFGDVPYITQPTIDAASFSENASVSRTPADQIRQSIIENLTAVENNLPAAVGSDYPQRATQWAAKTLKLKTYLWLEDYQQAVTTAQDIVQNSGHSLLPEYADIFRPDNEFNDEIIFQFDFIFNEVSTNRSSRFQPRAQDESSTGVEAPDYFNGFANFTVYESFARSFATNDLRRKSNTLDSLDGVPLNFTYVVKQFRPDDARENSGLNYKFYRFADVLLNLAEAENELNGPTLTAYSAINQVRARAGLAPLEDLTQDELREAIKQERAWELVGEGTHRKMDLLRWDEVGEALQERLLLEEAEPNAHPNLVNNIRLTVDNYAPYKDLLPIPAEETILNPSLTQNEGYQ
jgi:hypothetical protein